MIVSRLTRNAISAVLLTAISLPAADWPMWRCIPGHTAESSEQLPSVLHLQWVLELPPPVPAWPASQTKLQFDASYEPVVNNGIMFIPSMVSDSLTALDAATGEELWRFYADGPVRFAPAAWSNRVFVASDDGYLYCLDARSGSVVWQFCGGPDSRRITGNYRLVSMWPMRGAPVVYENTVYCAAGIWPFMGVFIYALDAETGKILWSNTGSGSRFQLQQHDSPAFAGVAPQGYLTVSGDSLLIAGGRTVPAVYDRHTGQFRYFFVESRQFGNDTGGYNVTALSNWFFNGDCMFQLENGNGIQNHVKGLYTENGIYFAEKNSLGVIPMPPAEVVVTNRKGAIGTEIRLAAPDVYALSSTLTTIFIKAGSRLYGADERGTVLAIDLSSNLPPAISWTGSVQGTPWSMLAADGKLFVVTLEGQVYCFGEPNQDHPRRFSLHSTPRGSPDKAATEKVRQLIARCGIDTGYCVLYGIPSGPLLSALLECSRFHLIVVDPSLERVDALRRQMDTNGIYGRRISAFCGRPTAFNLPPYLAALIITEDSRAAGFTGGTNELSVVACALRPYGGTAILEGNSITALFEKVLARDFSESGFSVAVEENSIMVSRPGPLPGSASWTHQYADAGNTLVSRDSLVKLPLGALWFGGPANDPILPRHGHGPSPQIIGGRLFIEGPDLLRAVDVYTGCVIWEKSIPGLGNFYDNTSHQPGANEIGSNYVSTDDSIYVMLPDRCLVLDPASGNVLRTITYPANEKTEPPRWGSLRIWENYLIATFSPIQMQVRNRNQGVHVDEQSLSNRTVLIPRHRTWRFLKGVTEAEAVSNKLQWLSGRTSFGFTTKKKNDKSSAQFNTHLPEMSNEYSFITIRRPFMLKDPEDIGRLELIIKYDDAFITRLNGHEVLRVGVGKGSGQTAEVFFQRDPGPWESFEIENPRAFLRKGSNVLVIEGYTHSDDPKRDFTLDPYLVYLKRVPKNPDQTNRSVLHEIPEITINTPYASSSGLLVVMDRHSGQMLWQRPAQTSFRHNAMAAGASKMFCIDGMSPRKTSVFTTRVLNPATNFTLYALSITNGTVLWQTDTNVFGTWLGYSEEQDILFQGGSASTDRAFDEVSSGMVAYRGRTGKVLWQNNDYYSGPCLLHHNSLIMQAGGTRLNLHTGLPRPATDPLTGESVRWTYQRHYGCNYCIGSEHLLTFRSAAAGYFDLDRNGGTGNLGGFKSGCSANLIAADGVLNAPDYTRTCTCSYQNQASLALIHMPDTETWTFNDLGHYPSKEPVYTSIIAPGAVSTTETVTVDLGNWTHSSTPISLLGINFGAPGDRLTDSGTLWLDYPDRGGLSPHVPIATIPDSIDWYCAHSSFLHGNGLNWVGASGARGLARCVIVLAPGSSLQKNYTVRMFFAEPDECKPGERIFSIRIQGKPVRKAFDIAREAGQHNTTLQLEFKHIPVHDALMVELVPESGQTQISGIELLAETE